MRLEMPRYMERLGGVKFYGVQRVLELTGGITTGPAGDAPGTVNVSRADLENLESEMAVIVPVKDENPKLLEGVLSGIPHEAFVIIVSNSSHDVIDRYRVETDVVFQFYRLTRRPFLMIHQKDKALAKALAEAGYPYIIGEDGVVRNGKGEGMIVGLILAKALGKRYVGFIDSDNYIPGSVNEYVDIYAAGFYMAKSRYAMVRLKWPYKTKFVGRRFYFRRRGRVSEITNKYMNMLVARVTGFESDIIQTSNAGEHAMTMELAERMAYSSGFSIEPYEVVHLLENYTGIEKSPPYPEMLSEGVEVFQVEPRNPHIHEERGEEHIPRMMAASLGTIYHSRLADEDLRARIIDELIARRALKAGEEPPKPRVMPPFRDVDAKKVLETLEAESDTLAFLED